MNKTKVQMNKTKVQMNKKNLKSHFIQIVSLSDIIKNVSFTLRQIRINGNLNPRGIQ